MMFFDPLYANLDRQKEVERNRENSARRAVSEHTVETRGVGQVRASAPIEFHVTFLEEPRVYAGYSIAKTPLEAMGIDAVAVAGVRAWTRNDKGFYTGAILVFRIDLYMTGNPDYVPPQEMVNAVTIVHHLSFSALGYKDLKLDEDIDALVVRDPWRS